MARAKSIEVDDVEVINAPSLRTVYSQNRTIQQPRFQAPRGLQLNTPQVMDGVVMLKKLRDESVPLVFFDPQYRTILDRQQYGNEGERQRRRGELPQMDELCIRRFLTEIERVLIPSGHLMLWVDKFILCSGIRSSLLDGCSLQLVDMITWNKERMGMGYRSRRFAEHLVILQKNPTRAKGVWKVHDIPDVWSEKIIDKNHTHAKPIKLQERLIEAVTNEGDVIVDPASGGYSVMRSAARTGRHFLGCDLNAFDGTY